MPKNLSGGPSRPGSSRAGSMARDIMKRHHKPKPFKTRPDKHPINKETGIRYRRNYNKAPAGYIFMPIGISELSDRCKQLSKDGGFPVNSVNSKPRNVYALDPDKVSHHIMRIGYNFKSEVVQQACEELGYIPQAETFVKESDLREKNQKQQVASIAARFGLNLVDTSNDGENLTQVRAAIREMFPRIPDNDLESIVQHAWAKGSDRVGTNKTMDLARRVQLAVLACIRHNYTDYDYLLKAMGDWPLVRSMVEPVTLQKLKEWMPEDADESAVQHIKETIVIDDSDDSDDSGDENDTDASFSDASIEVVELDVDEDMAVEKNRRAEAGRGRVLQQHNNPGTISEEQIPVFVNTSRENVPERVWVDGRWWYNEAYQSHRVYEATHQPFNGAMPVYGTEMMHRAPVHGAPAPVQYSRRP